MLCRNDKRVYNLRDKQIVKILSRVFNGPVNDMTVDLEKGEMPETAKKVVLRGIVFDGTESLDDSFG